MIYRTDMAVLEGETSFYDVKYLLNGDNYYFSIAKSPIFGEDGSVVGICGIGRDISDRKRTENALSMANKKLDLLSKITRHDLRNKITAISGYCELIKDETGEGYANELIEKQELSLEEMNRIIEFLKKYEVVESEPAKWIDMQPEITEYISSIESNGIRIDVKLEDLEIFSDIIFIRIFSDLINNSIVHGENVSFIDISWKKAGDTVVIVYEDNGCGIADDLKEKIFIKGFGRGTGLGLYYIREILNVLGMSIKETGKSGTGAVFEINVPLEMCHFRPA